MVNGKNKGSSYEREISKKLSLWLSEGKRDDSFWRTQNSGGRFTTRRKLGIDTQNQDGDITSTDPSTQFFSDTFTLELKKYKDINLWGLFTGKGGGLLSFWEQTKRQALSSYKVPVLIVKQDRKPDLWISNKVFARAMNSHFAYPPFTQFTDFGTCPEIMCIYFLQEILDMDPVAFKRMVESNFK